MCNTLREMCCDNTTLIWRELTLFTYGRRWPYVSTHHYFSTTIPIKKDRHIAKMMIARLIYEIELENCARDCISGLAKHFASPCLIYIIRDPSPTVCVDVVNLFNSKPDRISGSVSVGACLVQLILKRTHNY